MVKTILTIEGMMCGHCEAHVNEAIKKNFKVKSVQSSHEEKITTILSKEALDENKIKDVIEDTGYKLIKTETVEQ